MSTGDVTSHLLSITTKERNAEEFSSTGTNKEKAAQTLITQNKVTEENFSDKQRINSRYSSMISSEISSHFQEMPTFSPQQIKPPPSACLADNEDTFKSTTAIYEPSQQDVATEDSDSDDYLSSETITIRKQKLYSSNITSSPTVTTTSDMPPESSTWAVNVRSHHGTLLQTNVGQKQSSEWQSRVSAKRREFHSQMFANLNAQREMIQEKDVAKQAFEHKYLLQLQESRQWKLSALQYKRQLVQQLALSESLRRQVVLLRAHGSALNDQIILLKRDNLQMQIRNRHVEKELEKTKLNDGKNVYQSSANAAARVPSPPLVLRYNRHLRSYSDSSALCLRRLPSINECADRCTDRPLQTERSISSGHTPLPQTNRIA